jgi:hypothetical protein
MEGKGIRKDLLAAAYEFNKLKLWKRFTNYDCFGVRIPDKDEIVLGVVLGDAGEEYGITLFQGPDSASSFAALLDSEGMGDDALDEIDMLGFSMLMFGELPPEDQALMREAGMHRRYDEQVPHFLVKAPGMQGKVPNESELSLLLLILRGVVKADKERLLKPARLEDEKGICILSISGEPEAVRVSVTRERLQNQQGSRIVPLLSEELDLTGIPRLNATWLVGFPTVPAGIQGDDRLVQLVLVVDEASEYVIQGTPVLGGVLSEALKIVMETFQGFSLGGQKGLPQKIIFSSRKLFDAMMPRLKQAGVECVYEPVIPKLQNIMADFTTHFNMDFPMFSESMEEPSGMKDKIPEPDDLKAWKEADLRLAQRFANYFEQEDWLRSSNAIIQYFVDDDLEYYIQEHAQRGVIPAYTAWGILDYRPTSDSRTRAEKMLEKGLPEAEAILLRARMEACPTLYRVLSHDPKTGTVDLEDVLLGGTVTVHDKLMSENIENSLFLAARTFLAGSFHFIEMAGPPLGAGMGMEAVEYLQECGVEFTPEGLRQDAHMFGWLWGWIDEWQEKRKSTHLSNTDGDEFIWHTASFSVSDPEQVRSILMQCEDVDYDEEADELVWSKEAGSRSAMPGGRVTLGRLEFVGDELILTVNSARRFKDGRKLLEELPGVVFQDFQTRRWDEPEEYQPLDERISEPEPVEMTPELIAGLQENMDKYYMGWIDTPLPVLKGATPRQACRTEAGRQQVITLIRTMPDPMGQAPVQVPRQAMLRELGLAKEHRLKSSGREKPQPSIPIQEITPRRKIPRNAPCPCGSGRKYKKCCGRQESGI